jgi:2-iminobutanoate/2-iminopropanoate deaminase
MLKHRIETTGAPAARPVLSQGVRKGPILQVSGQGPADPATGEYIALGDVAGQTTRTLKNVLAVVEAGGGTFEDVVMLRVYLSTQADFAAMNEAYAAFLAEHVPSGVLPARTTVGAELPDPAMLVEIDALAVLAD